MQGNHIRLLGELLQRDESFRSLRRSTGRIVAQHPHSHRLAMVLHETSYMANPHDTNGFPGQRGTGAQRECHQAGQHVLRDGGGITTRGIGPTNPVLRAIMGIDMVKSDGGGRDQLDPAPRQQRRSAFIDATHDQHIRVPHLLWRERLGIHIDHLRDRFGDSLQIGNGIIRYDSHFSIFFLLFVAILAKLSLHLLSITDYNTSYHEKNCCLPGGLLSHTGRKRTNFCRCFSALAPE